MQAGRLAGLRSGPTRFFGASGARFRSHFDGHRELSRAATHVDACDGVLSDAGSTPAASTTYLVLHARLSRLAFFRLQNVSKPAHGFGLIKETNRAFNRCRTQVHVTLRRGQIHVTGEFLDSSRWCAAHRQMRTE